MTENDLGVVLSSLFSLALLWIMWVVFYRAYFRDRFRQRLFEVRDEMFDFCCEQGVPFETKAYVDLRNRINGLIQYADRISLGLVFVAGFFMKSAISEDSSESLEQMIGRFENSEVRSAFESYQKRTHAILTQYVLQRSVFFLGVLVALALVYAVCYKIARHTWPRDPSGRTSGRIAPFMPGIRALERDAQHAIAA